LNANSTAETVVSY